MADSANAQAPTKDALAEKIANIVENNTFPEAKAYARAFDRADVEDYLKTLGREKLEQLLEGLQKRGEGNEYYRPEETYRSILQESHNFKHPDKINLEGIPVPGFVVDANDARPQKSLLAQTPAAPETALSPALNDEKLEINGVTFTRGTASVGGKQVGVIMMEKSSTDTDTGITTTQTATISGNAAEMDKTWNRLKEIDQLENKGAITDKDKRRQLDDALPREITTDPFIYGNSSKPRENLLDKLQPSPNIDGDAIQLPYRESPALSPAAILEKLENGSLRTADAAASGPTGMPEQLKIPAGGAKAPISGGHGIK